MRQAFISEALVSVRQLDEVLDELTAQEIEHLIRLEERTQRRKVFLDKLYREARQRAKQPFIRNHAN